MRRRRKNCVVLLLSIMLVGCAGTAQRPNLNPRSRDDDPAYKEIKKLVEDQSNCFKREALSKSVTTVDVQSGANAVIHRCAAETARFKAYSAAHQAYQTFLARGPGVSDAQALVSIAEFDLSIGIHPAIISFLLTSDWQTARAVAREHRSEFVSSGYQADGLMVKAGASWLERSEEYPIGFA